MFFHPIITEFVHERAWENINPAFYHTPNEADMQCPKKTGDFAFPAARAYAIIQVHMIP
jgi:hypothetical protein